jgi:uncharacterized protein with ATP-grasp and redox domains
MHLTPEQKREVVNEVLLALAERFGQQAFWKPLADEIRAEVANSVGAGDAYNAYQREYMRKRRARVS